MPRVEGFPYLRPNPGRLEVLSWRLGGEDGPLLDYLPHWDPQQALEVVVNVQVDMLGIAQDCQLSPQDQLRLALIWSCNGTALRGRIAAQNIDQTADLALYELAGPVEGRFLSGEVHLHVQLLLGAPGQSSSPLAAHRAGSLLWAAERGVALEGSGSRFPSQLLDFRESSWLPAQAAWYLEWDCEDPTRPVLAGIQLYLNSAAERIKQAVTEGGRNPAGQVVTEIIRYDAARTLICGLLGNEEFVVNPERFEEGSVGAMVRRLIRGYFPGRSLESLRDRLSHVPAQFECELQDRMKLFNRI